jgi:hypothetical protein
VKRSRERVREVTSSPPRSGGQEEKSCLVSGFHLRVLYVLRRVPVGWGRDF